MNFRAALLLLVCCNVVGGVSDGSLASISITAEFLHFEQPGTYRSELSAESKFQFFLDDLSQAKALWLLGPGNCFASISWKSDPGQNNDPESAGPAVICFTSPEISEEELNELERHGKAGQHKPAGRLEIPLTLLPSMPGDNPNQPSPRRWSNSFPLDVQLFLRGCGEESFRQFGHLHFGAGALEFRTWVDGQGRFQAELAAQNVLLDRPDLVLWQQIVQGCGGSGALPQTPAPGFSLAFEGSSVEPQPDPATTFGQLQLLAGLLETRIFEGSVAWKTGESLTRELEKIGEALQDARSDRVFREIGKFENQVEHFVKIHEIDRIDGDSFLSLVERVRSDLESRFSLQLPTALPEDFCPAESGPCPPQPPCEATTFYVDSHAHTASPDGTRKSPFTTIAEAFDEADKRRLCGVDLALERGSYPEDILISRNTSIRGVDEGVFILGSILNHGPHHLSLSRLTILPVSVDGADAFGVYVDHPCAKTEISNVVIRGAHGYGIRHVGGNLAVSRSLIAETVAQPEFLTRGTGIYVTCGARTVLTTIGLVRNESAALQASGEGTRVEATELYAFDTDAHPRLLSDYSVGLRPGLGAVQVRLGARLHASLFAIQNSLGVGLVASSAMASLENGRVVRVRPRLSHATPAGHGVASVNSADISLQNFLIESADLCGLLIAGNGHVNLFSGRIRHNPVGVCLQVDGYDVRTLMNDVLYEGNGTTLEATTFPIPDAADPDGF